MVTLAKRGLRVLPIDLLAAAIEQRPRDLTAAERIAYELPRPLPRSVPRAWQRSNETRKTIAREAQVHEAEKHLRKLLAHLAYDEETFRFRMRATFIGIDRDLSWALARVGNMLVDRGHLDEAVEVYRYAIDEGFVFTAIATWASPGCSSCSRFTWPSSIGGRRSGP